MWRYSSEFRKWEDYAWLEPTGTMSLVDEMPATLIGDFLYWRMISMYIIALNNSTRVLKYVKCPQETDDIARHNLHIIKGHGGGVGIAASRDFNLHTWFSAI